MADSTTEVRAEVIERGLMDPTEYDRWLADKGARVARALAECKAIEVTDRETYRSAKSSREELNKVIKAIDAERIESMRAIDALKGQVKADTDAVLSKARERSDYLKGQVDAWDEAQLLAKMAELAQDYEDMAPALVPLVPFERVWRHVGIPEKWANKSMTIPKCQEGLQRFVQRVADDERTIESFEMADADRDELKAEYFRTLDLGMASKAVRERMEARGRVEALERERRSWRTQDGTQVVVRPVPRAELDDVLVFEVDVPVGKAAEFVAAMRAIDGVHGRKVGTR